MRNFNKTLGLKRSIFLLALLVSALPAFSQVIPLNGKWKFHIKDDPAWASRTFDDSNWESILAPSAWEDQGFNGYDGFAWYRKKFDGRELIPGANYFLGLGYIDDADEVYLNGKLIGFSGSMPPSFKTAYNNERHYNLPNEMINFHGDNVIAIRVYDITQGGGIIDGNLGIFRTYRSGTLYFDLQGVWSFAISKDGGPITHEGDWHRIMVPGAWEHAGYYKYDGYAWYRRTFTLPADYNGEPLSLLLGKIDDFDVTYVNGHKVGVTNDHRQYGGSHSYLEYRVYDLPAGVLKAKGVNTIEVYVEDMGNIGGIYEGPVGLIRTIDGEQYK